jgi:asparagine synthase (glutamine-hydrolysing)
LNSNLTETEKTTKLESLLKDAISLRQISDVKVGSFLSGGLDSSYVTKIMHENSKDLNTFTIGFKEKFDEAPHAQKVADFIGTKHHSIYLEASDVKDIILDFTKYFDEPFSDDAAIPMLFLSREAKKTVKVVISSDGGDEVFAGYSRYIKVLKTHEMLNRTPDFVLNFLKNIVKISIQFLPKQSKLINNLWRFKNIITKDKYKRLSNLIFFADRIPTPELNKVLDNKITKTEFSHNFYKTKNNNSPLKNLLYIDLKESLVNQMLVKVDKSTMGASIEGREPLLDHRLFEFMASCSDEDLIKDQKTKYLFRKIINKEFNDSEILNKPKLGFNTPIYNWLCFSFDSYVEEEFRSINELKIPYLKQEELLNMWSEFKLGNIYYQNLIWRSLIWVQWYKRYKAKL